MLLQHNSLSQGEKLGGEAPRDPCTGANIIVQAVNLLTLCFEAAEGSIQTVMLAVSLDRLISDWIALYHHTAQNPGGGQRHSTWKVQYD